VAERDTRLQLFGSPTLSRGGAPQHISRKKAVALLAYLAVESGAHGRDKLCGLFWGGLAQTKARRALRTALANLREVLPSSILLSDREQISLSGDGFLEVDVVEYRERFGLVDIEVRRTHRDPSMEEAQNLSVIADFYRGEFMSGFFLTGCLEFDDWQFDTGEQLRRHQEDLLWLISRHHAAAGNPGEAVVACRQLLSMDPTDEEVHRDLMTLLMATGDRAAALRQFEQCREILLAELKSEPEPETVALHQQILSVRPEGTGRAPIELRAMPDTPKAPEAHAAVGSGEIRLVSVVVAGLSEDGDDQWDVRSGVASNLISSFHDRVTERVHELGGEVVQRLSDDLIAVFGSVATHEDDPTRATLLARSAVDLGAAVPLSVSAAVRTGRIMFLSGAGSGLDGESALAAYRIHLENCVVMPHLARQLCGTSMARDMRHPRSVDQFLLKPHNRDPSHDHDKHEHVEQVKPPEGIVLAERQHSGDSNRMGEREYF
jgi:DNA-binding SARP family transcriptional activator